MGIQSDRWITRMAREHRMIEPFEGRQMREGVISYGVSSYGYDMRVAREFKIFTNVLSSIVDPKNFDPRSFVEFEGDVCIVPPNSFALARSVEYFRIPRDVVTVTVGKSTYARCFSGDTRVALINGTDPMFEELATRAGEGERFWGYSVGEYGRIIVTRLEAARLVGRDRLLEITLDDGVVIRATPDHGFIRRDGQIAHAADLAPGDSLMPLCRELVRGCESVYQPLDGQVTAAHRLADEWNIRHGVYTDTPGTHSPHRDHSHRGAARLLDSDRSVFRRFRHVVEAARAGPAARNHRVAGVRHIPGEHDVYCLTVPEAGNFALAAGVFVENCGIITNVTPFEPEWEGFVTLEISNTTPLPAKIYANEGIAQVLFFKGDEPPEISYADKKGKYQGQKGVTLPKL
jgi:deoxycytidine triphosphate deaminase